VEEFWVPTLALLGLSLLLPFAFFFGAVIYFYLMGYVFKNFEQSTDKR
jgi:high-affinity Fe2+/Pb2+ permease